MDIRSSKLPAGHQPKLNLVLNINPNSIANTSSLMYQGQLGLSINLTNDSKRKSSISNTRPRSILLAERIERRSMLTKSPNYRETTPVFNSGRDISRFEQRSKQTKNVRAMNSSKNLSEASSETLNRKRPVTKSKEVRVQKIETQKNQRPTIDSHYRSIMVKESLFKPRKINTTPTKLSFEDPEDDQTLKDLFVNLREIKPKVRNMTDLKGSFRKTVESNLLNVKKQSDRRAHRDTSPIINISIPYSLQKDNSSSSIMFGNHGHANSINIKKRDRSASVYARGNNSNKRDRVRSKSITLRNNTLELTKIENNKHLRVSYYTQDMVKALKGFLGHSSGFTNYSSELFVHQFNDNFRRFSFINSIDIKQQVRRNRNFLDISQVPHITPQRKYLFVDLDETLVFCSTMKTNPDAREVFIRSLRQTVR